MVETTDQAESVILGDSGIIQSAKQGVDEKAGVLRGFQSKLDAVRKQASGMDSIATPLVNAINARSYWPQLLDDLNQRLPKENIWVTELIALSNGKTVSPDNATLEPGEGAAAPPASTPIAGRGRPGTGAIDGLLVRGLYLTNPRQQEVVVDYFKNLVNSPFFKIDPNNQAKVIHPTMPNNADWAFPYELRLDLKQTLPLP